MSVVACGMPCSKLSMIYCVEARFESLKSNRSFVLPIRSADWHLLASACTSTAEYSVKEGTVAAMFDA
eukprot:365809-Chlamydomonas_euryale.AAC.2